MTTRWRCSPRRKATPAAWPTFNATSAVMLLLARPRMPSVPKYLRAMRKESAGRCESTLASWRLAQALAHSHVTNKGKELRPIVDDVGRNRPALKRRRALADLR